MTMYEKYRTDFGLVDGLCGKNEKNENVILSIDEEKAVVKTLQSNNFIRINIFWKEGIEEELYEH